jgi:hypothetical protein
LQPFWHRWCRALVEAGTTPPRRGVNETIRLTYSYDRDYALEMLNRHLPKSFSPKRNSVYALVYSIFGIDGAERLSKLGQRLRGAA